MTPPGRGAVATVRVAGEGAAAMVGQCFLAANVVADQLSPRGAIRYGRWRSPTGEEVVVCRRPITFQEREAVEIHCHGGTAAVRSIVQSLVRQGAQEVAAAELRSAPIDHLENSGCWASAPAIAHEARLALASAPTLRTADILLNQWRGALAAEIEQVLRKVSSGKAVEASRRLEELLRWAPLGLHLTTPWRVVLAGRPNVGKSSLINALLGYQRSIVFDQPGTTRDVVSATAALDGWPVELTDTAGLRGPDALPADELETAGIVRAREQIAAADLVVLVLDAAQPWGQADEELLRGWPEAISVLNKWDLAGQSSPHAPPEESILRSEMPKFLRTSAITGEGVEALGLAIAKRLVAELPHDGSLHDGPLHDGLPHDGAAIPFTERQVTLLAAALAAAKRGGTGAASDRLTSLLRGPLL
jgi:tRNA modification GTPase